VAHILACAGCSLRSCNGPGGDHAGEIEEATDGRGRGARRQARRALEAKPQRRVTADGGEHERAAIARVRAHQAQGSAAQAREVSADWGWLRAPAYAAFSVRGRVTFNSLSTGTGARSVLIPGQPARAKRSTSLSLSAGASLVTWTLIVTLPKADDGASAIMWPRASNSVRATASKLS